MKKPTPNYRGHTAYSILVRCARRLRDSEPLTDFDREFLADALETITDIGGFTPSNVEKRIKDNKNGIEAKRIKAALGLSYGRGRQNDYMKKLEIARAVVEEMRIFEPKRKNPSEELLDRVAARYGHKDNSTVRRYFTKYRAEALKRLTYEDVEPGV